MGKYTNGDAVNIIETEGLSYAVLHYCSGDDFKDPETAARWKAADDSLSALVGYLEEETGREVEA